MSFTGWELLDSYGGLKKYIRSSDEDDGTVQVKYEQDITATLEANKRAQNEATGRMGDGMQKVATIPTYVIYEWITKHGINLYDPNHQEGVQRLLNSSDYRWLKVRDIII